MPPYTSREQAIEKALDKVISVEFDEIRLNKVAAHLEEQLGQPILIDRILLEEQGQTIEEPVTATLRELPARSLLDVMLNPLGLTWYIDHEVVWITTQLEAENTLVRFGYDVTDLTQHADVTGKDAVEPIPLINVLTGTVEGPWKVNDGYGGNIGTYIVDDRMILVIAQTAKMHRRIAELLVGIRSLRRIGDAERIPPAVQKKIKQQPRRPLELKKRDRYRLPTGFGNPGYGPHFGGVGEDAGCLSTGE